MLDQRIRCSRRNETRQKQVETSMEEFNSSLWTDEKLSPCEKCANESKCVCAEKNQAQEPRYSPSSHYLASILNLGKNKENVDHGISDFRSNPPQNQSTLLKPKPASAARGSPDRELVHMSTVPELDDVEEGAEGLKKPVRGGRWTADEHERFLAGFRIHGHKWKRVQHVVKTRTVTQVRTHAQKFLLKQKRAELEEFDSNVKLVLQKREGSSGGWTPTSGTFFKPEVEERLIQDAAVTLCSILTQDPDSASSFKSPVRSTSSNKEYDDGSKRKQYLCRKCKVPKKGHVCGNDDDTTDSSPSKSSESSTPPTIKRPNSAEADTSPLKKRPRVDNGDAESVPTEKEEDTGTATSTEVSPARTVDPPTSDNSARRVEPQVEPIPEVPVPVETSEIVELAEPAPTPPSATAPAAESSPNAAAPASTTMIEKGRFSMPIPLTGKRVLRLRGHENWSRGIIQAVYRGSIYLVYENHDNPEWLTNSEAEKCLAVATGRVVSAKLKRIQDFWPAQTYVLLKVTDTPRVWTMVQFLDDHSTAWVGRQDVKPFNFNDYAERMKNPHPSLARAVNMAQKIKEKNEASMKEKQKF